MRYLTTLVAAASLLAARGLEAREIGSSSPEWQGFCSASRPLWMPRWQTAPW